MSGQPFEGYDSWLERSFQRKEHEAVEFETLLEYIEDWDLHPDPQSLNIHQARQIVEDHQADVATINP